AWLAPRELQHSALEVCPSVPSSSRDSPYRYPQPRSGELPNLVPTSFLILLPRPTPSGALSPPPPTLHHTLVALTPPTHTHPPLLLPTSLDLSPCLLSPALGPRSASLLSLQTELLLDLVAEAQSRRLEEQRATFHPPKNPLSLGRALPRPLEDREQLYSTILSHQCQRMEAQRSEPPLPPGGQELLELLLRVQGGGRMEEQRSRPPTHTC
uniref:PBX homeobox 2 n=1 Tax=Bos taurus TaxID=9913 RepID=A0ABI0NL60_BOVIN